MLPSILGVQSMEDPSFTYLKESDGPGVWKREYRTSRGRSCRKLTDGCAEHIPRHVEPQGATGLLVSCTDPMRPPLCQDLSWGHQSTQDPSGASRLQTNFSRCHQLQQCEGRDDTSRGQPPWGSLRPCAALRGTGKAGRWGHSRRCDPFGSCSWDAD